ncbi:MAG: hypothetical protein FJZ57_07900, partial [Chlamydiae bacterium]|nr:hypothetical protein [Chlamydiota bacterium]
MSSSFNFNSEYSRLISDVDKILSDDKANSDIDLKDIYERSKQLSENSSTFDDSLRLKMLGEKILIVISVASPTEDSVITKTFKVFGKTLNTTQEILDECKDLCSGFVCSEEDFKKYFSLLHGDVFIKNTDLEGSFISKNIKQLLLFFGNKKEYKSQKKYLQKTADLINISREELNSQISSLCKGETLLLLGGWSGSGTQSGHAVIYELSKNNKGNFDIKIINTGDGLEFHAGIEYKKDNSKKTLSCPFIAYKDVPAGFLGFDETKGSYQLVENLWILNNHEHYEPKNKAYEQLAVLEPFRDRSLESDFSSYITPQRSGTCSMKCLLASLKGRFNSVEEYKIFKAELKYDSLVKFYHILTQTKKPLEVEDKAIFNDACKKLLLSIAKLRNNNTISHEIVEQLSRSIIGMQETVAFRKVA